MLKPFKKFSWELTILSGVLIGLAYQPWKLGFLVYVGFIPIILVWMQNDSIKNFKHGYLFGFVYNLISNYWIGCNSGADFYVVLLSLLFAAGYLHGIINKMSIKESLNKGTELSSTIIQKIGAKGWFVIHLQQVDPITSPVSCVLSLFIHWLLQMIGGVLLALSLA